VVISAQNKLEIVVKNNETSRVVHLYILSNIPTGSEESYQDFWKKIYTIIGIVMEFRSNYYFDYYLPNTSRHWPLDL
jgi:hypothetical protein